MLLRLGMRIIDTIKITYTPKIKIELQDFACFYPILSGKGSSCGIDCRRKDNQVEQKDGILEAGIEYEITYLIHSFRDDFDTTDFLGY